MLIIDRQLQIQFDIFDIPYLSMLHLIDIFTQAAHCFSSPHR